VRAAVHDVADAVGLPARDRDGGRRKVLVGVEIPGRRRRGEPREEDQLGHLASVERQLDDALVIDDLADARAVSFDGRRVAGHRHLLRHVADPQRHVDHWIRADLEHDTVLDIGVEARQRHLELIGADGQVREHVPAVMGRDRYSSLSRVRLGHADLGAGDRRAARISDNARELGARDRLGPPGSAGELPRHGDDERNLQRSRFDHGRTSTSRPTFPDGAVASLESK
jgi:hypothetical protein